MKTGLIPYISQLFSLFFRACHIHYVVYSKRVSSFGKSIRMNAWYSTSLSSVVLHGSWLSILSFYNDSYSNFYDKLSWHGADASIITEVTIVNTPDTDYNGWTNRSFFITWKMTKSTQSIIKIDLKTKSDLFRLWTSVSWVFYAVLELLLHCELHIAERARLSPSKGKVTEKWHHQINGHLRNRWQD